MPKFEREVVNILIDQGWQYVPGVKAKKHKLIPPDPTKRARYVACTPSDVRTVTIWIGQLRRSGAILDEDTLNRISRRDSRRRLRQAMSDSGLRAAAIQTDATVVPISTRGASWRPSEPPAPAPEPAPEPVKPAGPDPDARGQNFSLGQARALLMQGYHVSKVIRQTGWGINHLKDLVDNTGYINLG